MSEAEDDVRSKQLKIVIVGDGSSGKVYFSVARLMSRVTGQLADTYSQIANSRTGQFADWSTRGCRRQHKTTLLLPNNFLCHQRHHSASSFLIIQPTPCIGVASYGALGHVPHWLTTIFSVLWRIQSLTATICRQSPHLNSKPPVTFVPLLAPNPGNATDIVQGCWRSKIIPIQLIVKSNVCRIIGNRQTLVATLVNNIQQ